jgi:hypothetical protein
MPLFPEILLDRLWHSTLVDRFTSILTDGAILPEPDIPDSERYGTAMGAKHYPYVRTLGGVSLFDFSGFCPKRYAKQYSAVWEDFVPQRDRPGNPIWIEVCRQSVAEHLISPKELESRRRNEKKLMHAIMPLIESAHIGPIKMCNTKSVLYHLRGQWLEL